MKIRDERDVHVLRVCLTCGSFRVFLYDTDFLLDEHENKFSDTVMFRDVHHRVES